MLILLAKKGMNYAFLFLHNCGHYVCAGCEKRLGCCYQSCNGHQRAGQGPISEIEVKHCKIETIAGCNCSTHGYLLDFKGEELYPLREERMLDKESFASGKNAAHKKYMLLMLLKC